MFFREALNMSMCVDVLHLAFTCGLAMLPLTHHYRGALVELPDGKFITIWIQFHL